MKRYGKAKRKTYRRRRKSQYRKRRNTALRDVRVYKQKLKGLIPVIANSVDWNEDDYVFSRFDYEDLNNTTTYGINTSTRWDQVVRNYEEYAVTGFKVKWIPSG